MSFVNIISAPNWGGSWRKVSQSTEIFHEYCVLSYIEEAVSGFAQVMAFWASISQMGWKKNYKNTRIQKKNSSSRINKKKKKEN